MVLDIKGKYCFRNMRDAIYEAASEGDMLEYLEEKFHWGDTINLIDWKAHKMAIEALPPGYKYSVLKGIFNWRPTNERLHILPLYVPYVKSASRPIHISIPAPTTLVGRHK